MKTWIAVLLLGISPVVMAGGPRVDQDNDQTVIVMVNNQPGSQGPVGPAGNPGPMGPSGSDASIENRLETRMGADVRWYDWKHASIHSGYRYDLNHGGHTVDMAVVAVKIGESYQDRQIGILNAKIEALQRMVGVASVSNEPIKSTIRGNP